MVVMSKADADARAFGNGAKVVLRRGSGQIEAQLKVSETLRPGVLLLEGKWWDGDDPTAASMNRLTPSVWSPAGQPAYNETYVTIQAR